MSSPECNECEYKDYCELQCLEEQETYFWLPVNVKKTIKKIEVAQKRID